MGNTQLLLPDPLDNRTYQPSRRQRQRRQNTVSLPYRYDPTNVEELRCLDILRQFGIRLEFKQLKLS